LRTPGRTLPVGFATCASTRRGRRREATRARLATGGVEGYRWTDCWDDYRYSILELLFVPMGHWEVGLHDDIWWPHLENVLDAFEDLNCAEMLGG
jgi:hypothetical protein